MRYALFVDHNKVPIKTAEIRKNVLKNHKNIGRPLISLAQQKFADIFGFEFVELPKKSGNGESGNFILKNGIEEVNQYLNWDERESSKMALLMSILSLIQVSNNELDEESLFEYLTRLGLHSGMRHPLFDEWEKLIKNTFTREQYLQRKKGDKEGREGKPSYVYKMGPRALEEIGKRNVLKFISLMYGEERVDPQLMKMLQMEEEEEESSDSSDSDSDEESQSQSQSTQKSQKSQQRRR